MSGVTPPRPPAAGMPLTGVATFARAPLDPAPQHADFAVFGVPYDCSVGFRPGQRLAPRSLRDLSTRYALPWGPANPGYWDVEDDEIYLQGCSVVDVGDVDPLYADLEHLQASAEAVVGACLNAGAVPVGLGGDHSVSYPLIRALAPLFAAGGPLAGQKLDVVQLDAHLDFSNSSSGFRASNSTPFRRASELPFVGDITVIGIRGLRTSPEAWQAATARGNRIVRMKDITSGGIEGALRALPRGRSVYVSIDIDGLDPTVAPGTSSPEPGGLSYAQARTVLKAVAAQNRVVGMDLVEVNPYLDVADITSLMGARLLLEVMAFVHASRTGL